MANTPPNPEPPKVEEIPLKDIDKILEQEDPEFTKSLEEVRAVEADPNVVIQATITDDNLGEDKEEKPETGLRKIRTKIRTVLFTFRMRLKARLILFAKDAVVFLKTKPKEYALYSFAILKIALKTAAAPIAAFKQANRLQKLTILAVFVLMGLSVGVLLANFKGVWLPALTRPMLTSLADHADWVETFDPKEKGESFYAAFPQERHDFLFKKMKVNLTRTSENPNPMGAFEVIVSVDSKDTAIEMRDREVELHDLLQRVFEEETFNSLESELGKARLKGRIQRELNDKLTQGWVKEVTFKTFVLKP